MTTLELRSQIHKEIDKVPDNLLPELLNYIKQLAVRAGGSILQNENIQKILKEDAELLKRLAQ